ncbi:hypothetical protein JB92DRAFT_1434578 [Gautieria morchelliformis]|nr:hypothetical protein JB92DRAFT_1434578 [Gautieria morchelliformis]
MRYCDLRLFPPVTVIPKVSAEDTMLTCIAPCRRVMIPYERPLQYRRVPVYRYTLMDCITIRTFGKTCTPLIRSVS